MTMWIVVGLWGVVSALTVLLAFVVGAWSANSSAESDPTSLAHWARRAEEAAANAKAEKDRAISAESRIAKLNAVMDEYEATVKRLTAERDAYRVAAESHEVKWPVDVDRSEVVKTRVWTDRPYRSTIGENFKLLAQDLNAFSGKELTLGVRISAEGGAWAEFIGKGNFWAGRRFTGTPERIVNEFELALSNAMSKNGSYPFLKGSIVKEWAGGMAPIRFGLDLWVREPAATATKPLVQLVPQVQTCTEVQIVEVPVFEERIVEKIVPRPLSDNELDELVRARVEVELAARTAKVEV